MPAPPKHRDSIIDAAVTLFRQYGYSATGLNDIVALSGAPKGSLYHYFPAGKASIAEAAVREAGRRVAETVRELAATAPTCGDLIVAHGGLLAEWMAQSDYRDGSPITTVLLENAPDHTAITAAGARAYADWRDILVAKLAQDGFAHDHADRLATLCMAVLDGALVQARVARSGRPLADAAAELALLLRP